MGKNKTPFLITVLVFIFAVVTLLFLDKNIFVSKSKEVPPAVNSLVQAVQEEIPNQPPKKSVLNLGLYLNEELGFQFEVPKDLKIEQDNSHTTAHEWYSYLQSPDFQMERSGDGEEQETTVTAGVLISIYVQKPSPGIKSVDDILRFNKLGRGGPSYTNEKIVKIDNENAVAYDVGQFVRVVSFPHDNNWIMVAVSFSDEVEGETIFNQVLSTFKFSE